MALQQYTAERADVLAVALEAVVDEMRVVAKSESSVRLSAVEYKFISVAKQCRDICALAVRGDKRYLQEVFSPNDCARIGRMRHACQSVQKSYLFVTAELKEELLASIASVEQVLRDTGNFKAWQPQMDSKGLDQALIAEEGEFDNSVVDSAVSDRTGPLSPSSALVPQDTDFHEEHALMERADSSCSTVALVDCESCGSARSGASTVGVVDCAEIKALQNSEKTGCLVELPSEESLLTVREPVSPSFEATLMASTDTMSEPRHHEQRWQMRDASNHEVCKHRDAMAAKKDFSSRTSEEQRPAVEPQRRSQKLVDIAPFTPRVWQRVGSPQWSSSGKDMLVKRTVRRGGA